MVAVEAGAHQRVGAVRALLHFEHELLDVHRQPLVRARLLVEFAEQLRVLLVQQTLALRLHLDDRLKVLDVALEMRDLRLRLLELLRLRAHEQMRSNNTNARSYSHGFTITNTAVSAFGFV